MWLWNLSQYSALGSTANRSVNFREKPIVTSGFKRWPSIRDTCEMNVPLPCFCGEWPFRFLEFNRKSRYKASNGSSYFRDWLSNGVFFLVLNRHVTTLPTCCLWQRERERQGRRAAMDSRCPLMQSNVATTGPLCLPADILLSVQLKGTFADVRRWCAWCWQFQHVGFQHGCL